jgi:formylglycine-generating enzyme required for sulfatase activity
MDTVKVLQEIKLQLLKTQSEMILIPGGTFLMGSSEITHEGPQHEVTVSPFLMGRYPVTQAQWRAVASLPQVERELDPYPSQFKRGGSEKHYYPVESISWYEAMEFCARLSAYADRTYTLPSEAQWEYACRADTTTAFYFGETITTDLANYDGTYNYGASTNGVFRKETTPVDSFLPNEFGLYDMHGNVSEWCLDHFHPNYDGAPNDGSAWLLKNNSYSDSYRMLRGGSWDHYSWNCRCAYRTYENPDFRLCYNGFRVVSVL